MPRISSIAVCVFLLATSALAQVPKGNVFFGYSYVRTDAFVPSFSSGANLNGWEGSLEGKVFPHVGIVADASAHYGGQDFSFGRVDGSVYNFLFGPQVSVGVGKLTPFAHVLIGAGHVSASSRAASFSTSDTSFADALGGRPRLQTDPGRCLALPGGPAADPFLQRHPEQLPVLHRHSVPLLSLVLPVLVIAQEKTLVPVVECGRQK